MRMQRISSVVLPPDLVVQHGWARQIPELKATGKDILVIYPDMLSTTWTVSRPETLANG